MSPASLREASLFVSKYSVHVQCRESENILITCSNQNAVKIMLSASKMIVTSILIATIGDFIAFEFYPQGGSRVGWALNQVNRNLMKLQRVAHRLADIFCNEPEECKNAADEFFVTFANFPRHIYEFVGNFLSQTEQKRQALYGTDQKKYRTAKVHAADYTNYDATFQGNLVKVGRVLKSLRFSRYEENNLCDLKEGIPPSEYDVTVDEIADLTNMPEKLKNVIKRAKSFTAGNVITVDRLHFKTKDGNMVFGRVAVIRRGENLDMAYSLHSVKYELKSKQRQSENAEKLQQFYGSLEDGVDKFGASNEISFDLRKDFLAFFHNEAIQGFVKHCDFVLKTLRDEDRDKVLKQMGV